MCHSVCKNPSKGPKGLTDSFYGYEKVEKTFWFVIYSYLGYSAVTVKDEKVLSWFVRKGYH